MSADDDIWRRIRAIGGYTDRAGQRVRDAAGAAGGGGDFGPTPTRRRPPPVAEPSRAPGAGGGQARYIRSGAPVGGVGPRRGNPATTKAWQTQAANKALLQFVMSHYAGGLQQGVYNKLLGNEFQPPQRGLMSQVRSSPPPMYVDF